MNRIGKCMLSALMLAGAAAVFASPASAEVGIGLSFGYGPGFVPYSDPCDYYDYYDEPPPWGLPPDYCDYPVYFDPVYYDGYWYRGPIYYRWYGGERLYWLNGGWRHDGWRGARPEFAGRTVAAGDAETAVRAAVTIAIVPLTGVAIAAATTTTVPMTPAAATPTSIPAAAIQAGRAAEAVTVGPAGPAVTLGLAATAAATLGRAQAAAAIPTPAAEVSTAAAAATTAVAETTTAAAIMAADITTDRYQFAQYSTTVGLFARVA